MRRMRMDRAGRIGRGWQAAALSAVLVLPFGTAAAQNAPGVLIVTGDGSVTAVPDLATVSLGVLAEADAPGAAVTAMADAMTAVLDAVAAAGIAPRDVQTGTLSLGPVYADRQDGSEVPVIDRYQAVTDVTVRVRDISGLGGVLDAVVGVGANRLNGVSFGLQDPRPAQDEALAAAVADARHKAELMAQAAGMATGAIRRLSEGTADVPRPMMREAAFALDTAVAAGEVETTATVTLEVALTQP